MTNEKTNIPVWGTIYSNLLPQLSMQMSTNANTNVECNVKLTKYKHFFVVLSNFTYFLFWQILNTSIVLLSNFPHSTFFWQILHTSVTIFHMISSCPGGGCPPLDPDIHVDLCQLFTWPRSAFPRCDIITSTPFYFGLKVWIIAIKKNIPDLDLNASLPSDWGVGFLSEWISLCVSQKLSPLHTQQGHLCHQHTWHTLLKA